MQNTNLSYLIAEDHEFQRRMLVRILTDLGANKIYEAADGHAALAITEDEARPVDIVISDLDMPGMDGMEFIRHLGEAKNRVSLILASALERKLLASVETMTEAYGINLLGIVEKPLTLEKLGRLIKRYKPATDKPARAAPTNFVFTLEEIMTGLRNGEIDAFFQPKVELATGKVKGAEALARWRHPMRGIVAPCAFIPVLEEGGAIDELTWAMLSRAAGACKAWHEAGLEGSVSVNLSLRSLSDTHLADRILDLVRAERLEPQHIVLEITESAATTDIARALENLARLRMKGFGLSIDDYGTGYSSMQQLARIPFTELKIDQSFVTNASKQESARVILKSSLDMAKKLKITAVAEGIETKADWKLVRQFGCALAQGFFIARAMEAQAFPQWVRNWQAPECIK